MEKHAVFLLLISIVLINIDVSRSTDDCVWRNFEVQEDFDIDRYTGKWYEWAWVPLQFIDNHYTDYTHSYEWDEQDPDSLKMTINAREHLSDVYCHQYYKSLHLTDIRGKLEFQRGLHNDPLHRSPYWVIATDYENYSLVYGCREENDNGTCSLEHVDCWIWGREMQEQEQYLELAYEKVEELCLSRDDFVPAPQNEECEVDTSFLPTDGGETVTFSHVLCMTVIVLHIFLLFR